MIGYIKAVPKDTDVMDISGIYKLENVIAIPIFDRILYVGKEIDVDDAPIDSAKTEYEKFNNLVKSIAGIPYVEYPTSNIREGANCRTLTIYIADWAEKNNILYDVKVEAFHTFIKVRIDGDWFVIDFDKEMRIYNEHTGECIF